MATFKIPRSEQVFVFTQNFCVIDFFDVAIARKS